MRHPALQLDFVAPRRRARAAGLLVLAASLALAGGLVFKYTEVKRALYQLDAAQALLETARPARALPREGAEGELKSAREAVRQLALPWAKLIDSLERASNREVALLHIQPDAQNRVLRLTAETRREELMLEYLRRLGRTGAFADVHLLNHHVREDDPARPIQFSVQASFRGSR